LRAHLAELGIVAAQGDKGVKDLLAIVADEEDTRLPIDARASVDLGACCAVLWPVGPIRSLRRL
jgi:hypothetical protein